MIWPEVRLLPVSRSTHCEVNINSILTVHFAETFDRETPINTCI